MVDFESVYENVHVDGTANALDVFVLTCHLYYTISCNLWNYFLTSNKILFKLNYYTINHKNADLFCFFSFSILAIAFLLGNRFFSYLHTIKLWTKPLKWISHETLTWHDLDPDSRVLAPAQWCSWLRKEFFIGTREFPASNKKWLVNS